MAQRLLNLDVLPHMRMKRLILGVIVLSSFLSVIPTQAGLIFTIEGPGIQATSVPGVVTETFDSAPLGAFSGSIAVGTLTSGGAIVSPDAYGGSFGTRYYAVGVQSGSSEATLTLNSAQNYVGLWWPAGDAANRLEFYNGAALLGAYNVGDIIPLLSPGYYGNPNNGLNPGEPYVYLNFTATGADSITSVAFKNNFASGFEIDNISVTSDRIDPPGIPIGLPDNGATAALLGLGIASLAFARRRFIA